MKNQSNCRIRPTLAVFFTSALVVAVFTLSTGCMAYVLTGYRYEITGRVMDSSTGLPVEGANVLLLEGRRISSSVDSTMMHQAGESVADGAVDLVLNLKYCRKCYGPPSMWNTEPRQVLVRIAKDGYVSKDVLYRGNELSRDGMSYVVNLGTVQLDPMVGTAAKVHETLNCVIINR